MSFSSSRSRRTGADLLHIRNHFGLTQVQCAKRLGISRSHLAKLEREPGKALTPKMARLVDDTLHHSPVDPPTRRIPIRSWAQAGAGIDFEELPLDWQDTVPTDCPDSEAFAVELKGDSMEPKYIAGDLAILMPGTTPKTGCLVVARLQEGDVMFKIFNPSTPGGESVVFSSLNQAYPPLTAPREEIAWIYPVYQIIRNVWTASRR